ncbi:MAG: hypothetical protein EXR70_20825 [Deltaproteobacteria bacterium]|nr:hypothetical protein [Deltaproteobacteria bacterium]
MQLEVQHAGFTAQRLAVETAEWFRGPRLLVNGSVAAKKKGCYTVKTDSGADLAIWLKYNFLDPIPKVKIGDESMELASPLKWHEYVWIGIPIALVFVGGAIGGLAGGLGAHANGRLFRSDRGPIAKYGLSALISLAAGIVYVALATTFQLLVGGVHT